MIFLIEFNRLEGRIITKQTFSDDEIPAAEEARLELDLNLHRRRVDHEVVLLEAASEEALRRTHRRYFEDARQIVESTDRELK